MKKLYRKSTVHPTQSVVSDHLLSFLPAALFALAADLSPADREVLAYVISCSSGNSSSGHGRPPVSGASNSKSSSDHPPSFSCNCFRCYMSYWVKWDSSPNRVRIHEIIDAFEENLTKESKKEKSKKEKRRRKSVAAVAVDVDEPLNSGLNSNIEDFSFSDTIVALEASSEISGGLVEEQENENEKENEEESEKGPVRRLVSFLGERILAVLG